MFITMFNFFLWIRYSIRYDKITQDLPRSTHSCLPWATGRGRMHVDVLCLLMYIFLQPKIKANEPRSQNRARANPPGTGCLIGKNLISLGPYICSPASSRSPSGVKTSQMGLSYPTTPQIYNFPPPNPPNSERNHPPAISHIVYIYLLLSPTPTWHPCPITHPRPPIRHPRHIQHSTCSSKKWYLSS